MILYLPKNSICYQSIYNLLSVLVIITKTHKCCDTIVTPLNPLHANAVLSLT